MMLDTIELSTHRTCSDLFARAAQVMEEEELAAMRAHQEHFEQLRNAELVATQKMEQAERRKVEEKERRLAQARSQSCLAPSGHLDRSCTWLDCICACVWITRLCMDAYSRIRAPSCLAGRSINHSS
jgi:Radial spoke protein 3